MYDFHYARLNLIVFLMKKEAIDTHSWPMLVNCLIKCMKEMRSLICRYIKMNFYDRILKHLSICDCVDYVYKFKTKFLKKSFLFCWQRNMHTGNMNTLIVTQGIRLNIYFNSNLYHMRHKFLNLYSNELKTILNV